MTDWVAVLQRKDIGGIRTCHDKKRHINELELLELKLTFQTFLKYRKMISAHIQMEDMATLAYLQ